MTDKHCPNLKNARIDAGFTQKQARRCLDVSISTLSGWETGVHCPPLKKLKEMAALYGVSTDYLLGLAPSRKLKAVTESRVLAKSGVSKSDGEAA